MSESDDSDILADIQALDEALALTTKKQPCVESSYSRFDVSSSDIDSEDDDYTNYLVANRVIDESLDAYEINRRLIAGLMITKKKLTVLIQQCEQKIKELDDQMTKSTEEWNIHCKIAISNAGMPYFKDKNHFSAPKNYDTKLKESRGELFLLSIKTPNRWSRKDREILLSAIQNEAIESVLSGEFSNNSRNKTSEDEVREVMLPRNFNEMVGAVGEREFDWYKISAMDFENKHSPGECRAMWNVYLHPNFRKSEWTNAEDNRLLKYVKQYKYQDWDVITQKLGTCRSAYQCFIRYNTIKKVPSSGRAWTKQEDKHLIKVINKLKIGDCIPWAEIANHLRHRTKQQIYTRWTYRKAPHLKKGRFTYMETNTLMKAVQMYGMDFCKISNLVMTNRTSIQLSLHYNTIISHKIGYNKWTLDDDMKLIYLQNKHSNDWSKIATYYSDRTRTQVRHRYAALLKYIKKGLSLQDICRPSVSTKKILINKKSRKNTSKHCNKGTLVQNPVLYPVCISDIQQRLYETLCCPPLMKTVNPQEELYDFKQLEHATKKLYNVLNLLNANLDIPGDFLNYVHLNRREKQLLISLKEYINSRNKGIQNNELIEKYRMQMFGPISEVNDFYFIPPLPFDGYVRIRKVKNKMNKSIDLDLDVNKKFLIDMPTRFSITPCIFSFISIEEEIQFHKFSQLLVSDYHNCDEKDVDLYKSIKCILSLDKGSTLPDGTSLEYNKLSADSKTNSEDCRKAERIHKLREIISTTEHEDEETISNNIILPNEATLLGFKNLLLWKLLYEHQNESHNSKLSKNEQKPEQSVTDCPIQGESAEYQLLRTRLLQLFKLPISLSNTILQVRGPETIFSTKRDHQKASSRKRKRENDNSVQPKKSVYADSKFQIDPNIKSDTKPVIRSSKIIFQKYRIIPK